MSYSKFYMRGCGCDGCKSEERREEKAALEACNARYAEERRLKIIADEKKLFERRTMIERLVPLAKRLMLTMGDFGATVSDLREYAEKQGVLSNNEDSDDLCKLGHVFRATGRAISTGRTRRSHSRYSHGNLQRVWTWDIRYHPQS